MPLEIVASTLLCRCVSRETLSEDAMAQYPLYSVGISKRTWKHVYGQARLLMPGYIILHALADKVVQERNNISIYDLPLRVRAIEFWGR